MFKNRLQKNAKHFSKWAKRQNLTGYRVYDRDMPEYPYVVDFYNGYIHVSEFARSTARAQEKTMVTRNTVFEACCEIFQVDAARVIVKAHHKNVWGQTQYKKMSSTAVKTQVTENGLLFEVNLSEYLDTGLFFDHRNTRQHVRTQVKEKSVLNLFAYTGSFSVYALAGGARRTLTVDLSPTYCVWARRNFALNGFAESSKNQIVCDDVLEFLNGLHEKFDVVVLDPPVHSTSKRMARAFDVQKNHPELIENCLKLLAPSGQLFFSTNFRGFELSRQLTPVEETTKKLKPDDMRENWHRSWLFRNP